MSRRPQSRVYPRVYGESNSFGMDFFHTLGLSPRVRGIPLAGLGRILLIGSIPACTGNPDYVRIIF